MSASEQENEEPLIGTVVFVFLFATILIIGCICSNHCGYLEGQQLLRAEAVERGFAEWVPDKEGNTTFKWKEVAK